jgi:hypothetical protein
MPDLKPTHPQTLIIQKVFAKLNRAYKKEVHAGRFDDVPYQTLTNLKDRNFQRLLELSRKLLVYFSEDDRYYRQWLGLAVLLVREEVETQLKTLSFDDFQTLVRKQWQFDMRGAVPLEYFNAHKEDFQNMVLANFLMNLV